MGGKAPMNSEDQNRDASDAEKGDWRRIHHSPVFWVGIVLCLARYCCCIDLARYNSPTSEQFHYR
jgi:hypothetical protein